MVERPATLRLWLGQHEAFALRFRNGIPEFACGVDLQLNGFVGVCERGLLSVAMSHTTRQFRNLSNENMVLIAPINDDLVFVHAHSLFAFEPIAHEDLTRLRHLVHLGLAPLALQIDQLPDARPPENVVTATGCALQTQASPAMAKLVKADVGVRLALQNPKSKLIVLTHRR